MNKNKNTDNRCSKNSIKRILDENIEHEIPENSKTCSRCKKDFHIGCFINKNNHTNSNTKGNRSKTKNIQIDSQNKNICCFCEDSIEKISSSMKISDFFKYEKKTKANNIKNSKKSENIISTNKIETNSNDVVMFDFNEKKNENVAYYPKFILWKSLPKERVEELKENLKNALIFKNIEFSDDLAFLDQECGEEMNNAMLEPGIQKMSSYNKGIFYKFKERTRKGEYPGLEIIEDSIQVIKLFKI